MREATPAGHWRALTLLGALTPQGMLATRTVASPTAGAVFLAYREQVLCPQWRPGHGVVRDNLGAHQVAGVRQRIAATGAELPYLPPDSPDCNPSSKPARKPSHGSVRPRLGLWKFWRKLWRKPSLRSPPRMPPLGFATAAMRYTRAFLSLL